MAIKKKVETKEEKVEVKKVEKAEKTYICTELCYHNDTMYQKGDILIGEPPKDKNGEVRHFEEAK